MKKLTTILLAIALSLTTLSAQAQSLTESQQRDLKEIEDILVQYPQLIGNVRQGLEGFIQQQKKQKEALLRHHDWLYNSGKHPVIGNQDAEHSIIIFTDFNCPYCKRLEPSIEKIVKAYPSVNVVNVIVPLRQQQVSGLNTNSAVYGLNLWNGNPSAYYPAHQLLMKKSGMHDAESLKAIASRTDTQQWLKNSANSLQIIERNMQAFRELGFRGTPTIMIGSRLVPGYIQYGQIESIVQAEFGL